jgi:hypothetical protein
MTNKVSSFNGTTAANIRLERAALEVEAICNIYDTIADQCSEDEAMTYRMLVEEALMITSKLRAMKKLTVNFTAF